MVKIEFFPEPETVFKTRNSQLINYPLCLTEDPLLELVLKYKQDFSKVTVADPISLEDLISENIEHKPVSFPKREILGDEFTDEDYEKLCAKLSLQHEQFKKHQTRDIESKLERIKSAFPRLTKEEIFFALKEFEYNEDEVTICLTKNEFINQIRNQIAQLRNDMKPKERVIVSESESEISADENQISDVNSEDSSSEEVEYKNFNLNNSNNIISKKRKIVASKSSKKALRLRLDDALANVADMEGWSEARIRAYQGMKKNPNAYFYRFNAPGETQKNGPWSKEEDELFMKRLAEFGADGQWGIFSMSIPGRVGYQCSNYYRKLIEIGRIKDSNYLLDEKGKAHYIGGKTKATGVKTAKDDESEGSEDEESDEEVSEEQIVRIPYVSAIPTVDQPRGLIHENPLSGFIDAITQVEVVRPAISPYGHVLSYDTWLKCLLNGDRKNTCPLTNQPLHKRQLIFLTFENIEMYRDKIRQINE